MAKKKGSSNKKGKRAHKNNPTSKKYALYTIEGNSIKKKSKHCPRCGPGVFLGGGQSRLHCGRCHYTEFMKA
ncbi:MAG: 30S ribosomal protein S27ae [Candidatus Pacearchaeota archaeon]|nr:30S ribosomal protein S27ae [Candidatus Pacearchaeota archaeon]